MVEFYNSKMETGTYANGKATFEDPEFKVVVGRSWWGKTCSPTNLTSEYVSGAIATAILAFTYPITPV